MHSVAALALAGPLGASGSEFQARPSPLRRSCSRGMELRVTQGATCHASSIRLRVSGSLVRQCPAVWPRKAAGDSAVPWAHADWDRRQAAASTGRSGNWGLTVHNNKKLIRGVSSILHKRWSTRLPYSVVLVIRSRVTLAQGVATPL